MSAVESADLAELRRRTPLATLIGRRVALKRAGRLWKGCCPFHAEKTPSFVVYDDHFHCFGCGAHGDAVRFVERIEGTSFADARARLAAEAGMAQPARPQRKRPTSSYAVRLVAEAASIAGTLAERYLRSRGVTGELPPELLFHPAVWSPETASTHPALLAVAYDGEHVARVQAVLLDPTTGNKAAIDTPKLTFGAGAAHIAVEFAAWAPGELVLLTEGPEDAVSLWAATGHRTLASLSAGSLAKPTLPPGTDLVISADADDAGRRHAARAADAHRARGCQVRVIFPPIGAKDANDLLRQGGLQAVRDHVRAALLEIAGLAPADPPFPLPTGTLAEAHADLARTAGEFFRSEPGQTSPQILLSGEGGTGKTDVVGRLFPAASLIAKREGRPHRLIFMVPEHRTLGPQVEQRFRALGINAATLRGRGRDDDPSRPPPCRNLKAVWQARRAGLSPAEAVCRKGDDFCESFLGCEHLASVAAAAAADVAIVANNYLFENLPKAVRENVGWVVIDEGFADRGDAAAHVTLASFAALELERFPVREKQKPHDGWTRRLGWLNDMLVAACAASPDGYGPRADALRAAGLTADQADEAHRLSWQRKMRAEMRPGMDLDDRRAEANRCAVNAVLPTMAAVWQAVADILRRGDAAEGKLQLATDDTKAGTVRKLVVNGQRSLASWLDELPVLMLNATGSLDDARRFFPRTVERAPARVAAPHVYTRLILGAFGKSACSARKLADLRTWHAIEFAGDDLGIVTHKAAAAGFTGMARTRVTHHGASAGDDRMRAVDTLSVIGGMSARPDQVAAIAAARSGRPVPIARAVPSTAPVLMRDGSAVAVPVLRYEDPAAQAVHAGIFDASINQAAARPRGIMRTAASPLTLNIFANAAPAVPVDLVIHWRDIRPDRLSKMVERGAVFLNAADMHAQHPKLFGTEKAAADARARFGDILDRLRAMCGRDRRPWSRVRFQPPGQGMQLRWAFCRTEDLAELRERVEAKAGALVHWQPESFTAGRGEDIRRAFSEIPRPVRMSSPDTPAPIAAWATEPAAERWERPPDG